ncbi:putative motility protein [Paenibacillus sp. SYP-B3998]|uniref:Putative motility protein n=1 Tax=Paenibacillus sp. SYP-B3998 TaxID=2678564 RepID=A0A6G3ZT17_9BACL|nr:YjfB family protein [Paenibacillus sp. SYP-B3998]NEW05353.1 putative motility protein [Paenibacillus sp. SYP-B3998]
MDIAALSISMNQTKLAQEVGIRVLQIAQNQSVQQTQEIVQMMQSSVQPNLGGNLDIKG